MAGPAKGEVWAYVDKNFTGELVRYVMDTPHLGKMNDKITSVRVGPNTTAVLFADAEYKGTSKLLQGDIPHVGADFNDKASSMIILPGPGEVVFFVDSFFRGKSSTFTTDTPSLGALGSNDKFSSVKTHPTTSVEVWSDANYKGKSAIYSGAVPQFGSFNDVISSFHIRR